MAKITITFTAPVAPSLVPVDGICRTFVPTNAAADNAVFAGTYYDTNVDGDGAGMSIEQFIKDSVAHPGLIAALKKAALEGSYEFTTEDRKEILYLGEVASAIADQGYVIKIADEQAK